MTKAKLNQTKSKSNGLQHHSENTAQYGVVHILRNQPRGGVSKCLRLITGGGGGLVVDYVIKILIFTNFRNTNWTIFVDFVIKKLPKY